MRTFVKWTADNERFYGDELHQAVGRAARRRRSRDLPFTSTRFWEKTVIRQQLRYAAKWRLDQLFAIRGVIGGREGVEPDGAVGLGGTT